MALAAGDWFQKEIIDFLSDAADGIDVEDDSAVSVPGVVSGDWYDRALFSNPADCGWQVSVSPEHLLNGRIADLGGENKEYDSVLYLNVWVYRYRHDEVDYTPERIRKELLEQIDTILWQIEMSRSQNWYMDLGDWSPLDEAENKLLRSQARLRLYYVKNRGGLEITP